MFYLTTHSTHFIHEPEAEPLGPVSHDNLPNTGIAELSPEQ